ncbi:MAG: oxygenase MpaB family protein [Aeromicrobium sp.]
MSRPAVSQISPRQDYGFFGPDSICWKVFNYPTAMPMAVLRAGAVEMFEPCLIAAVDDTGAVMNRPLMRFERSLQYITTIVFDDSATAVKSSDVLMRIHTRIQGIEPISGAAYDANDPALQLWIHLTYWQSVLQIYEKFGPGPLTKLEDEQYWAECARAAEMQTFDPADVPRSRAEMREYYERVHPRMAATEATQRTVKHILDSAGLVLGDLPWFLKPARSPLGYVLRKGTIATFPRWMRNLTDVRQSSFADAVVTALLRPFFRVAAAILDRWPSLTVGFVRRAAPGAIPALAPMLLRLEPVNPVVVTPAEAWASAGRPTPREQYTTQHATRLETPLAAPADDPQALVAFA